MGPTKNSPDDISQVDSSSVEFEETGDHESSDSSEETMAGTRSGQTPQKNPNKKNSTKKDQKPNTNPPKKKAGAVLAGKKSEVASGAGKKAGAGKRAAAKNSNETGLTTQTKSSTDDQGNDSATTEDRVPKASPRKIRNPKEEAEEEAVELDPEDRVPKASPRKIRNPKEEAEEEAVELDPEIVYQDGEKHLLPDDFEIHHVLQLYLGSFFPCKMFHQVAGLCEMLDMQYSKAKDSHQHLFFNNLMVYNVEESWKAGESKKPPAGAVNFLKQIRRYVTGNASTPSLDNEPKFHISSNGKVEPDTEWSSVDLKKGTALTVDESLFKKLSNPGEIDGTEEQLSFSDDNVEDYCYQVSFQIPATMMPLLILQTPMDIQAKSRRNLPQFYPVRVNHPRKVNQRQLDRDKIYEENTASDGNRGLMQMIKDGKKVREMGNNPFTFAPFVPCFSRKKGLFDEDYKRYPPKETAENYEIEAHLRPPLKTLAELCAARATPGEAEELYRVLVVSGGDLKKKIF